MKPIVIVGTSHSSVRYSPSLTNILSELSTVKNLAAYGHGIDTYFPRVVKIREPSIFVIEAPHHTRYTEFMNESTYEPFSYTDDEFWTEKRYMDHLAFFSKSVLLPDEEYREAIRPSKNDLIALQRIKVLANQQLELEDNILKCVAIDVYLKYNNHQVYWWTANNKLLHKWNHDFHLLTDKPVFDNYPDKSMYPDGYHLADKYFKHIIRESFVNELVRSRC